MAARQSDDGGVSLSKFVFTLALLALEDLDLSFLHTSSAQGAIVDARSPSRQPLDGQMSPVPVVGSGPQSPSSFSFLKFDLADGYGRFFPCECGRLCRKGSGESQAETSHQMLLSNPFNVCFTSPLIRWTESWLTRTSLYLF